MLQQTQVATVIPYYRRFLQAFPTMESLAKAPLERVLEVWSGMGYYRRARNLHRAARAAVERFNANFPADYRQARTLPGVGDYTARAVLSIAYNQPYAVMDGNVARVVARLAAIPGNPGQPQFRLTVERMLGDLLSRRKPGAFNQALMELGQTVCLPRAPRCPACPIRKWCAARHQGRPENFPQPKPRRKTELHHLAAAILKSRGRVALARGLDDRLLLDLWNFPSAFGPSPEKAAANLRKKLGGLARGPVRLGASLGEVHHQITFRSIQVHLYPAEIAEGRNSLHWFSPRGLESAAVSQLARKIAQRLPADASARTKWG
jgi:A/G-specific adenine glycosylase